MNRAGIVFFNLVDRLPSGEFKDTMIEWYRTYVHTARAQVRVTEKIMVELNSGAAEREVRKKMVMQIAEMLVDQMTITNQKIDQSHPFYVGGPTHWIFSGEVTMLGLKREKETPNAVE
jgi:hypothetical protein